jgi:hypothetical protein
MTLTPTELAVLAAVHRGDEEEGGLPTDGLEGDELEALDALARAGLVELVAEEEGPVIARISWRGVEALRDAGIRR